MTDEIKRLRAASLEYGFAKALLASDERKIAALSSRIEDLELMIAGLRAEIERLRWFEEMHEPFIPCGGERCCEDCRSCGVWREREDHKPDCEYVAHGGKR